MLAAPLAAMPLGAEESADPTRRSLEALRLKPGESVTIDGRLDESFWERAQSANKFRQREPREGAPSTKPTEVRIAFDSDHLYVGAFLWDDDPAGIVGPPRERDAELSADDQFTIVFDTFRTGRTGFLFETNPAGVLRDGLLSGGEDVIDSWDTIWDVRSVRLEDGWQVEFAIPFRSIAFDADNGDWFVNFRRVVRRSNEQTLWTGYGQAQGIYRTIYAGEVSGIEGVTQGNGFEFKPYLLGRRTEVRDQDASDETDFGFDFGYNITPSLNAALTYNTDFADTEVDLRVTNLSRFPVRLPEKRDFFLEGAAVFDFPGDSRVTPYYSRRIGLVGEGPVPILAGGRLVGQVGRSELGFLYIRTEAAHGRGPETFTVARGRFTVAEESYLGGMLTRREGDDVGDRFTLAADGDLRLVDLGDGGSIALVPYGVYTTAAPEDEESDALDRSMLGVRTDFLQGGLRGEVGIKQVGTDYDPAVGFAFDRGYREFEIEGSYERQPMDPRINEIEHGFGFGWRTELDGDLIEAETELNIFEIELTAGDEVFIGGSWEAEQFDEDFDIWDGIVVPAGRYDGIGFWIGGETAKVRPWSVEGEVFWQEFYDGDRVVYLLGGTLRPISGLELSLESEINDVRLPGGEFQTHLFVGRLDHAFTTRHSLNLLTQYDNDDNSVGLQIRFRWQPTPGSELFLGYLHNWEEIDDPLSPEKNWVTAGKQGTIKGTYTWRF